MQVSKLLNGSEKSYGYGLHTTQYKEFSFKRRQQLLPLRIHKVVSSNGDKSNHFQRYDTKASIISISCVSFQWCTHDSIHDGLLGGILVLNILQVHMVWPQIHYFVYTSQNRMDNILLYHTFISAAFEIYAK